MYNYVKEINSTPTKDCEIPPNNWYSNTLNSP
jgi:hypothetical protein